MNKSRTLISLFVTLVLGFVAVSCTNGGSAGNNAKEDQSEQVEPIDQSDGESGATVYEEGHPTVIDFYATWCGPCKQISPVFDDLRERYADKANFVRVDVDADRNTAERYGISAMPTFVFLDKDGNEVDRLVGADEDALISKTKQLLGD